MGRHRPQRRYALLVGLTVLALTSTAFPSPAGASDGPTLPVAVSVSIVDGTATTTVRKTLTNTKETDVWFAVTLVFPSSAHPTRLAVEHGGTLVEEAAVSAELGNTSTEVPAGVWLAADAAKRPDTPASSSIPVALRVPAGDRATLVASWEESLRLVRGAYRYRLPLEGLEPSDAFSLSARVESPASVRELVVGGPFSGSVEGIGTRSVNVTVATAYLNADSTGLVYLNFTPEMTGGHGFVSSCVGADGGFFTYTFFPEMLDLALEPLPKSISFAIDFSGSMAGSKADQAKVAFAGILRQLYAYDRFEVLRFDSHVLALTSGLEGADSDNITRAIDRINGQAAAGSTNIGEVLERALTDLAGETDRLPVLVLMTDGSPTAGLRNTTDLLDLARVKNTGGARVHTLALGYETDSELLDALAAETGGTSRAIDSTADVVQQIADFYGEISQPLIEDLSMEFLEPAYSVTFPPLDVLYGGSDITAHGRLRPNAGRVFVIIEGRSSTGTFSVSDSFDPVRASNCTQLERAWALARVDELLARIRTSGENASWVREVKELALNYGFVTPFTPFRLSSGGTIQTEEPVPPPQEAPPADRPGASFFAAPELSPPAWVALLASSAAAVGVVLLWRRSLATRRAEE